MKSSTVKTEGFTNRTLKGMKEGLRFGNPNDTDCFVHCEIWNILVTMMNTNTVSIKRMCKRCKRFNIER